MSDLYFCPTVGEIESAGGSGFKGGTCCAHPELHTYIGYSTPGIEAISQYLSDRARAEHATGPDLSDWQSPEDAAYDTQCPGHETDPSTCRCGCEGCAHNCAAHREERTGPPIHPGQSDPTTIKMPSDAVEAKQELLRLQKVARHYRDAPVPRDDAEDFCSDTALESIATAIARHDLLNLVGLEPHPDLPKPGHPYWQMWRNLAKVALTAYSSYIEHLTHAYLSTGCRHGEHGYCQSNTGSQGEKIPAVCKFCSAPCVCSCHLDVPSAETEE